MIDHPTELLPHDLVSVGLISPLFMVMNGFVAFCYWLVGLLLLLYWLFIGIGFLIVTWTQAIRRRRPLRLLGIPLVATLSLVGTYGTVHSAEAFGWIGPSSEEELLSIFRRHRESFRKVGSMLESAAIEGQQVHENGRRSLDARIREQGLYQRLDVEFVPDHRSGSTLTIPMYEYGLMTSGSELGYFFSTRPPSGLVSSLDEKHSDSDSTVRPIGGGWYLYRQSW